MGVVRSLPVGCLAWNSAEGAIFEARLPEPAILLAEQHQGDRHVALYRMGEELLLSFVAVKNNIRYFWFESCDWWRLAMNPELRELAQEAGVLQEIDFDDGLTLSHVVAEAWDEGQVPGWFGVRRR